MLAPKKSLGQNFLRSKKALDSIIEAAELDPNDLVLEIGPGKGVLTEALLNVAREVTAIEKDDRLIFHLNLKFYAEITSGRLKIIHRDALLFDPDEVSYQRGGYKLVANIPYYITGALLRRFLSAVTPPSLMVLMIQKEVAKRILVADHKESLLSLSVKAYGKPEFVETVGAENFSPRPKVDSAILAIRNISKHNFHNISEENFFRILKAGFAHKRKIISANLKPIFGEETAKKIADAGIPASARPEDIPLQKWLVLARS